MADDSAPSGPALRPAQQPDGTAVPQAVPTDQNGNPLPPQGEPTVRPAGPAVPVQSAQNAPPTPAQAQPAAPTPAQPNVNQVAPATQDNQAEAAYQAGNAAARAADNKQPATPAPGQHPPPATAALPPPGGAQATTQSAPPSKVIPAIDPRPYAYLAEHNPQLRALVDQTAKETGVSPQRFAAHMYYESGFNLNAPDGKAGEVGPMQMLPSTAKMFNFSGNLDARNPADNMLLAGRYMHYLDGMYGQDTPSSVAAYQGGPGSADALARDFQGAAKDHPNTVAYMQKFFPTAAVGQEHMTSSNSMNAPDLIKAASTGGPQGFLKLVSQSASSGLGMTDAMKQAEDSMVRFFAMRGDVNGMQHARDYVLQLSHTGANQMLQSAYQSLNAGDANTAAKYLAKAHAFTPDGQMGQFSVDNKGQLWGRMLNERDQTPQGQPFQVTTDGIASLLNQTTDPGKFLQTVTTQREAAASAKYRENMGDYYANLNDNRLQVAQTRAAATTTNAETHADAQLQVEQMRQAGKQGMGPMAGNYKTYDAEANKLFGPDAAAEAAATNDKSVPQDAMVRGNLAEVYRDLRASGSSGPAAHAVALGLYAKKLQAVPGPDGGAALVDPNNPKQPLGYLSPGTAGRLGIAPRPDNQRSPIGAAATTPAAMAAGANYSPAGVTFDNQRQGVPITQSSAMPSSPQPEQQPQPTVH